MPPVAMKVLAVSFALALLPGEARLGKRQSSAAALGTEVEPVEGTDKKVWKDDPMQLGKETASVEQTSVKYEMVTVFEEAYFEKYTMCHLDKIKEANAKILEDLGAGSLATTKVISVGSSSTQVYSCGQYRGGFFSGAQKESVTQVEVDTIGKWLAATQPAKNAQDDVVILQSSALVAVVAKLCKMLPVYCVGKAEEYKAFQIWPEPRSHYSDSDDCRMTEDLPGKAEQTIDSENLPCEFASTEPELAATLKAIVKPYQRAFCEAKVKNTVLVTGKKLENDWTKALKKALGASYEKGTIVDWGGSGPKPPKEYLKAGLNAAELAFDNVYKNAFLVSKCDPDLQSYKADTCKNDGKLKCEKLKTAMADVVEKVKEWQTNGPWFIGQTGLAREKWMEHKVNWGVGSEECDLGNGLKISKWSGEPLRARILGNQALAALAWLQLPANASFQIKRS